MNDSDDIPTLAPRSYSGGFGIPMPDPDEMCEMCGDRVGRPQRCTTDGSCHGHGRIHAFTREMRLTWVCDDCRRVDAEAMRDARPA